MLTDFETKEKYLDVMSELYEQEITVIDNACATISRFLKENTEE